MATGTPALLAGSLIVIQPGGIVISPSEASSTRYLQPCRRTRSWPAWIRRMISLAVTPRRCPASVVEIHPGGRVP